MIPIGLFVGGPRPSDIRAGSRARRPRKRQPLRSYLVELWRHPNQALSDIAFERRWLQGSALLAGGLTLAGAATGATGFGGGDPSLANAPAGAAAGLLVGTLVLLFLLFAFHGMALLLEGSGSFLEFVSALVFAMLPVYAIVPAVVLRLLPGGWGGFTFFVACLAIGLWILRLVYFAIREGHRFSGLQAGLTMSGALMTSMLGMLVVFFGLAAFVLVS